MDNLTRRPGWMLMQLFTLKWSCLWFFVTIPISWKATQEPQAVDRQVARAHPGFQGCSWLCWKRWGTRVTTGGTGGGSWQVTANYFGGTVNVMRGTGHGRTGWRPCVSRHWDRLWGRLQDEVLGVLKSEAQQKPWRVPLASNQLLLQVCYLHSNQGPQSPAWWYSHSGIPESEKSWFLRLLSKKQWWWLVIYIYCV